MNSGQRTDWYQVYYYISKLLQMSERDRDFSKKYFPETLGSPELYQAFTVASEMVRSDSRNAWNWLRDNPHYAAKE